MKDYLIPDPWCIIEEGFNPEHVEACESIFSIGNGKMGQRANFEEKYSGKTLQGNYFAGIFYPDKTRVGWWKNGYPEYFGKMINAVNWVGINILIDGEMLDLATCKVSQYRKVLNMQEASLSRSFYAELPTGQMIQVQAKRFISASDTKMAVINYSVTPVNFSGNITFVPYLDGDVKNKDSNYDEKFWDQVVCKHDNEKAFLQVKTKKLDFQVCTSMIAEFFRKGKKIAVNANREEKNKYIASSYSLSVSQNETVTMVKYVANITSLDGAPEQLVTIVSNCLNNMLIAGPEALFELHRKAWELKWEKSDIKIDGDAKAQQGIRFNIFQLNQTYTGDDERLNIGPKGFTGEKYGGGTYWDTEAFCFPFYLNTSDSKVAKNLLLYRYRQLGKAIENGEKLGFTNGAALYPMVTINGEECHNEWEITFEEIHRNGSMAYAIYNYELHTNDKAYIAEFGLEVLIALSRFWKQRSNFSKPKNKYVILGVTGPNEYENNVNNNWYTNFMAQWTLRYTLQSLEMAKNDFPEAFQTAVNKTKFDSATEIAEWHEIANNMYFPEIEGTKIRLQQDGFLDKEQLTTNDIPKQQRPINQHWSWDRILRSVFIKQADVLQGMYYFINDFTVDEIAENFKFYEPMTVHESSLSPSIHSVLAAHIGNIDKAYDLYLRTSRLDLDDYNHEVHEGLHITSMAGTWLSIVEGFARKRIKNGKLGFSPLIPSQWSSYAFKIQFREHLLEIIVARDEVKIWNHHEKPLEIELFGSPFTISANTMLRYQKKND